MRIKVFSFGLMLACSRSPTPDEVGDSASDSAADSAADTTGSLDSEDTHDFVPNDEDSGETGTGPVDSHDEDILPLWTYNCVIYCHGAGPEGPAAGLSLEWNLAYDELVGVQATQVDMLLVAPGAPEDSYLWHKLNDTHLDVGGAGVSMPLAQPLLDAETLERIETWIAIGAPP